MWDRVRALNRFVAIGGEPRCEVVVGDGVRFSRLNRIEHDPGAGGHRVEVGDGAHVQGLRIKFHGRGSRVILGAGCRWRGYIIVHGDGRTVRIGARSTAIGVYIVSRGADVTIGEDCMFSRDIEVRSTDVHPIYDRETGRRINPAAAVRIGDRVWVAADATISKGSVIPDGCVVGAKSFVNRAFDEPDCVIAGVPAKVIRKNVRWER
ncbi:MAG: acyltransferase [Sandaracinaceae bacterium]